MTTGEIGRAEIALLLGVSQDRLSHIINHSNANMPCPTRKIKTAGKGRPPTAYSRKAIMEWIATDPLNNLVFNYEKEEPKEAVIKFLPFLFGFDGANKRMRRYYDARNERY